MEGIRKIESIVKPFWQLTGAQTNFHSVIYPGLGHEYTTDMWRHTLDWFHRHLERS